MAEKQEVTITGVDIGFRDLVNFLVKLALAAIPALVIISIILSLVITMVVATITGGAGV